MTAAALQRWASGAWLSRPLTTFAAALMLAGTVAALGLLFASASGTLDRFGRPLGTDFSAFWTAGRMALSGNAPLAYDWGALFALQRQVHGVELYFPWSYPPVFLPVVAVLAALPYVPALVLWQAASFSAAFAVFRAILPQRAAVLYALGFPAVLICLGHGQTGFLTAALLGGGILALPRSELRAGVLFGLLIYKPQFGLLLPFALAAAGYWRAIAAAAVTGIAACGLSLALWGSEVWRAFFHWIPLTEHIAFEAGDTGFEKFQSIFAWVRLCGGGLFTAYVLQGIVTFAALAACTWVWRRPLDLRIKGAALLTGTLLSSPYMLDYDLVAFGLALALLAAHALEHGFRPWEATVLALAWISPVADRSVAKLTCVPLGFLMLAAVFLLALARAEFDRERGGFPVTATAADHPG